MRQESNNEMDLILRKLGRESTTVPVIESKGSPDSAAEKHLDADELNAYAENALPVSTRARYTEHLADCTRCRQIVSQLSLASGLIVEEKSSVVPTLSGWKAFLSSLLSPMVLRYAVPAVLLLTVASIGFMVFRSSSSQPQKNEVATSSGQKQPEPVSVLAGNSPGNVNKANSSPEEVAATKTRGLREETGNSKDDESAASQKAGEKKPEQTTTDQISAAAAPASANEAAPAPKSVVVVQEQAQRTEDAQRKTKQVPGNADTALPTSADDRRAKEPEKLAKESESPATATFGGYAAGRSGGPSKMKNERSSPQAGAAEENKPINGRDRADKDNSEVKSVAGRRFRKEGSVWVDTAFDSSRRTIDLTRGSEQYRALVADEPEIKTIADQLGGEVIIVWKGTAYRIR